MVSDLPCGSGSATTDQNLKQLVEMLLHMSRAPDVVVNGKIVKENGREHWHDLPEFSFWFMEYAMSKFWSAHCKLYTLS